MKKLVAAAFLAGSLVAMAENTETKPAAAAPAAAEQTVKQARRGPLTPEQRAEWMAQQEKKRAARRAAMEQRAVEVIKKYGLDDEKAKALWAELNEIMKPVRRPHPAVKPAEKGAPKAE